MEPEYATASEQKIKREEDKDFYMPLYKSDAYGDQWMQGILWSSEKEALEAHKYDHQITRLKIFKITLPVKNVNDSTEV